MSLTHPHLAARGVRADSSVRALEEWADKFAPEAVKEASATFATAHQGSREARAALGAAVAAVRSAERADHDAAVAALRQGKPEPGTPAADAAREQAEAGQRRVDAASELFGEAVNGYVRALREHREEFSQAVEAELTEIEGRILPLVDEIEDAVLRTAGLRSLRHELLEGGLAGRSPIFRPHRPIRPSEVLRKTLEALRGELRAEVDEEVA